MRSDSILSVTPSLTEGGNVPAVDAVLFMSPRNSHIDIVQAVGRVMRKAEGKECAYIILPIAVRANVTPKAALDDNERFAQIWNVLRALRSQDDRRDAEINQIDLTKNQPKRIILGGDQPVDGDGPTPKSPSTSHRSTCLRQSSSPRSSSDAAIGSTGRLGRRTSPTSLRAS